MAGISRFWWWRFFLLLLLLISLVLGGRREKGCFYCVCLGFLNDSVTCQPKHEDKIEPCRCCFGFVMNQQVGSFT